MFATAARPGSVPIHLVHEESFEEWRGAQDERTRNWLAANAFRAERHKVLLVPGPSGTAAAVIVGLGRRATREDFTCWNSTGLPDRLPDGDYHLARNLAAHDAAQFAFGWAYGQYRFDRYRRAAAPRALALRLP